MAVPAVHEAAPQLVPAVAERQAPAPLQVPSNPQGGAAAHPPWGSLVPAATGEQVPTVPAAYTWQPPLPSQNPVVPQVAAPCALHWLAGSLPPVDTAVQVPALPASAHDMHVDPQVVAQQTPCAQIPVLHSVPPAQAAPV